MSAHASSSSEVRFLFFFLFFCFFSSSPSSPSPSSPSSLSSLSLSLPPLLSSPLPSPPLPFPSLPFPSLPFLPFPSLPFSFSSLLFLTPLLSLPLSSPLLSSPLLSLSLSRSLSLSLSPAREGSASVSLTFFQHVNICGRAIICALSPGIWKSKHRTCWIYTGSQHIALTETYLVESALPPVNLQHSFTTKWLWCKSTSEHWTTSIGEKQKQKCAETSSAAAEKGNSTAYTRDLAS